MKPVIVGRHMYMPPLINVTLSMLRTLYSCKLYLRRHLLWAQWRQGCPPAGSCPASCGQGGHRDLAASSLLGTCIREEQSAHHVEMPENIRSHALDCLREH